MSQVRVIAARTTHPNTALTDLELEVEHDVSVFYPDSLRSATVRLRAVDPCDAIDRVSRMTEAAVMAMEIPECVQS